ncbi:methionyl-tRNA formyltransferase [bacterium]|nr:methionyl-tRNA formyltransferase [bacterium]
MRLVYMGTPEFAVPGLKRLIEDGHLIAGVVTQPDRPRGRGLRVCEPAVKCAAVEAGLPVLQPEDLKDPDFLAALRGWEAECFIVVAFRILPDAVWMMPPAGAVNLHASLLPRYRGAAPIQWAVIRGETETGVTTFFIERKMDTGDWILQRRTPIGPEETAGELHDRLSVIGAECLSETVRRIETGTAVRTRQEGEPSTAPKILPEHGRIDWTRPGRDISNLVRGLSPHPGAYTFWEGRRLRLCGVHPWEGGAGQAAGTVIEAGCGPLRVAAGLGGVEIRSLQLECGRPMEAAEFLRGHRMRPGTVLGAADA